MSEQKRKIYTSGGGDTAQFLYPLGFSRAESFEEADVIAFSGGADINPKLYNEPAGKHTHFYKVRDDREVMDFHRAVAEGKKIIGICRGLQLICALSGGKLIQHVTNHSGTHVMLGYSNFSTRKNEEKENLNSLHHIKSETLSNIRVNSIHHQMIFPYNLDKNTYKILAWSERNLSTVYLDGNDKNMVLPSEFVEIETCYFRNTNALGWQYHPEMMGEVDVNLPALTFTRNTFMAFYNNEL